MTTTSRRLGAGAALVFAALAITGCAPADAGDAAADLAAPEVGVQLFQLPWTAVAEECERTIGPAGFGWVLVSPAQEHILNDAWWAAYQPVSYRVESRLGTREEFADMTRRCAEVGVDVIADAVVNHMTGQDAPGVGWAGSPYERLEYPGIHTATDFHDCTLTPDGDISDYSSRQQVQECELLNLADLDTASPVVRDRISAFVLDLLDLGAAGVRIDAAKHMAADDVAAIVETLPAGTWVISEVIRSAREPITPEEYTGFGEVFEFQYARDLFPQLQSGLLSDPALGGARPAHVDADAAVVFIDRRATGRGRADAPAVDGLVYVMANALMLADDFGTPIVLSGYAFTDRDAGALLQPDGRVLPQRCDAAAVEAALAGVETLPAGARTCVHAWPAMLGMVEWRRVAGDAVRLPGVDADSAYGFEREGRAVIAANPDDGATTLRVPTSLPDGRYCDVIATGQRIGAAGDCGDSIVVVEGGEAVFDLAPWQTMAIHQLSPAP